MKKLFISLLLLAMVMPSFAKKEYTEETDSMTYVFNPRWYLQGAFGYQYTIGETGAGSLSSPTAQIGVGYWFTPVWGLRLSFNGWESRDGINPYKSTFTPEKFENSSLSKDVYDKDYNYKWYYVAPMLDVKMDLVNLIGGWKHDRLVNAGILAGVGANLFFKNDQAPQMLDEVNQIAVQAGLLGWNFEEGYLWDKFGASVQGRLGAYVDFNVTEHLQIGAEVQGNMLTDRFNSKKAGNPDWYLNAMLCVKYNFGDKYSKRKKEQAGNAGPCEPQIVEKVVEVEKIVEVSRVDTITETSREPLRVEIFFPISSNTVNVTEYQKINQIVEYMNKYPDAQLTITGHADKSTGTAEVNQRISERRAQIVKDELINKHGIKADRISAKAMGDTDEPYAKADPMLNRVSICVAE